MRASLPRPLCLGLLVFSLACALLASLSVPACALAAPQAVSLSVGSDNHTHLLWNNPDGSASLWNLDATGSLVTSYNYGPYTDDGTAATPWHASALATGPNGLSHILWTNPDGRVILWTVTDSGSFTYGVYGPYQDGAPNTPWSATALSVGPDNVVHILWTNPDHRVFLWNVDSAFNFTNALYGPYTDGPANTPWNATAIATGPDNTTRLVWNNSDGRVILWNVDAAFNFTYAVFGPYNDGSASTPWGASALSVGPDNRTHILWTNPDNRIILWNMDPSFNFTYNVYGPNAGFSAVATGVGSDNKSRILWSGSDGSAQVWTINADGSYTSVTYSALASLNLTAAATGSNKITLYWNGVAGASGYNVYRGTVSGGPYSLVASNVTTADSGPGLTNAFMYSDAAGLTSGTEYFYIVWAVQSGAQIVQSNEDSAIPDASAVPWDTSNAAQIVAAVNATAANDLQPDDDGSGGTTPQQVGALFIGAPDGVVYMGNSPDGASPQAFSAPGKMSNGSFVYSDGVVVPCPDYNTAVQAPTASMQAIKDNSVSPFAVVGDHSPYPATKDPSGIWREVQAFQGFYGMAATIGLPDPADHNQVNLVTHSSTSPNGSLDYGKLYPSVGDIYSGGWVSFPAGTFPAGQAPDFQLDAGLQLVPHPGQLMRWSPIVGNARRNNPNLQNNNKLNPGTADKIFLDGSVNYLHVGNQRDAAAYKTYIKGEVRMQFLSPDFPSVRNKSVRLHFSIPVTGAGTGGIEVDKLSTTGVVTPYPNVQYITLEMFGIDGWLKAPYTGARGQNPASGNNQFIIKRVNSLAQTLNEPGDPFNLNAHHPGAPFANAPVNQAFKGYLTDGSYIRPFGGATFSGAYWGDSGDSFGVELWHSTGGWETWTDDASVTGAAGAYPNGYNNVVNWLVQNAYSWEQNVFLYAQ